MQNAYRNYYLLCVDDEYTVLATLRNLLGENFSTLNTEIASSADEALEIIDENAHSNMEPAIIIADQLMPGMKGDELLIRIHEQYPLAIKILLTGQATASQVGNALNKANLFAYIEKPWNKKELLEILQNGLNVFFTRKKTLHLLHFQATKTPEISNLLEFELIPFVQAFLSEIILVIPCSKITAQVRVQNSLVQYFTITQENQYCIDTTSIIQNKPEYIFFSILEATKKKLALTAQDGEYGCYFSFFPGLENVFVSPFLSNKENFQINIYIENLKNLNLLQKDTDLHLLLYFSIINHCRDLSQKLHHIIHHWSIISSDNHHWLKELEDIVDNLAIEKQKRLIFQQLNAESSYKIQLLLEQVPGIVWSTNIHLEILSLQGKALPSNWVVEPNMTIENLFANQLDYPTILRAHKNALLGQHAEFEFSINGRFFKAGANPLRNEKAQIIGCVVIAIDITEKKENELRLQQLLQNELELNLLKSNFLTLISHSFKTPLSNILLYTELLLRKEKSEEKKEQYLKVILQSANYINELIEDIVLIGQTDSDFQLTTPKTIRLGDYLDSLIRKFQMMRPELAQAQIEHIDHTLNQPLEVEEKLLSIILHKILMNALLYSLPNPKITITTTIENNYLKFSIEDNGIGILEEDLPFIAEPFYRGKNTNNFLGVGLGLNIVQRILHFKKGDFRIQSQVGKGTTCKFSYPISFA